MENQLLKLGITRMTHSDFDTFIDNQISNLGNNMPPAMDIYQPVYQQYLAELTTKHAAYRKSLQQMLINLSTRAIIKSDHERDMSIHVFAQVIDTALHSDIEAECDAAYELQLLLNKYKGLARIDYDGETSRLDKLIADLEERQMAVNVSLLSIQRHVDRMKKGNEAFKVVIANRSVNEMTNIKYDTNVLRKTLMDQYYRFTQFVETMANVPDGGYYQQALAIINNVRSRYAIRLSKNRSNPDDDTDTTPTDDQQ